MLPASASILEMSCQYPYLEIFFDLQDELYRNAKWVDENSFIHDSLDLFGEYTDDMPEWR